MPAFLVGQLGGDAREPETGDRKERTEANDVPAQVPAVDRRGEEGDRRTAAAKPPAPILVAPGPGGILIASEDLEALDDFELLLSDVAGQSTTGGREFAVYYLRFAKSNVVAETVTEIFGGGGGEGGGGGLLGDIAGAALGGGAAGDLVGGLLGISGGGGATALGSIDVVADPRLNALIVRAKPNDLDTLEQLLQILDQPSGPEDVQVEAPPRLIPVYNTSAHICGECHHAGVPRSHAVRR